jgi:hypothetical protein
MTLGYAPDWSAHPVDVLKWCTERMGRELDAEAEAKLRAICDEVVPMDAEISEGA